MSVTSYDCRTTRQRRAKARFDALIADQEKADEAYDALSETKGGRVISTDLVRELDPSYANWKEGDPPRDLAPSWESAWRYAHNRFDRELQRTHSNGRVRFMAGGWAAGKTRVVKYLEESMPATKSQLTWDGTLKDTPWAKGRIGDALKFGWKVEIIYVHRNIELAMYGAIDRGREEGRHVPLVDLPANHRAVQGSVSRLVTAFRDDPNVSFSFFHNIGSAGLSRVPMAFAVEELAPDGALHYRNSHEEYFRNAAESIEEACG